MEPEYYELYNPYRNKTVLQKFIRKLDAEIYFEERKLECPNAMKGWYIRAVYLPRETAYAALAL